MPTGEPLPPWAFPLHLPLFGRVREFPECEVLGVAFLIVDGNTCPGLLPGEVEACQLPIFRHFRGVEVDAVRGLVGETAGLDLSDGLDHLRNVVGRAAPDRWFEDFEPLEILLEGRRVELGNLPCRAALLARTLLHLVLAGVGIRRQVPHIRDVHHMPDIKPLRLKDPAHQVGKDVGA